MQPPPPLIQWPRNVDNNSLGSSNSGGSSFIPAPTTSALPTSSSSQSFISPPFSIPVPSTSSTASPLPSRQHVTDITSSYPVTITYPSTFTTYFTTVVTSAPGIPQSNLRVQPVCIGHGIDAWSSGLLATTVLSSVIGLLLWLIFAIIRPRFRQVYGLREWFPQDMRPKPLNSSLWAFLFPHVPLVPNLPSDVSDAGKSTKKDLDLFPSDEQLGQRTIWVALLICLGWSVLALGGALPIYLVSTPCLARSAYQGSTSGAYSVVQDLSLLRLLQLFDTQNISAATATVIDNNGAISNGRIRSIVLTILVVVLGVLPALYMILKEFNQLVAHRRRWVEVRCEHKEMGWLPADRAPGFVGWGEKQFKAYLTKIGLSSTLVQSNEGRSGRRNRLAQKESAPSEDFTIDVETLFSIGDTETLALLIDERDETLENLEVAETRYISSFRTSTPDPSIADLPLPALEPEPEPEPEPSTPPKPDTGRPVISRPRPLNSTSKRYPERKRARNPAYASSSLPPSSFLMPSTYYKLRGVEGISGGHFADPKVSQAQRSRSRQTSFSDSINRRIVGSRFQEVNLNSSLPLGSHVQVSEGGELGPSPSSHTVTPDLTRGPSKHVWEPSGETYNSGSDSFFQAPRGVSKVSSDLGEDWVDLLYEPPQRFDKEPDYLPQSMESDIRRRPPKFAPTISSSDHRESFPFRSRNVVTHSADIVPPHLRIQPQQPFVRPLSGLDHEDLSTVYNDISHWRTKLKQINADIAEAQKNCYNDIADGARIKGWLMVGKGLRFLPGIELIEGRSKEDIRWNELQHNGRVLNTTAFWVVVVMVLLLLAAALTAVVGLMLSTSPDVASYLEFLDKLGNTNNLATGIATVVCPTLAATLFITLAIFVICHISRFDGKVSVSGSQLVTFKLIFFALTLIAGSLTAVGAVLFAVEAFQSENHTTKFVANGSIIMTAFALALVINAAIISPALLILQPLRLWKVIRAEKLAITPRQRFRAVYPRSYDPSYALACCVLAVVFASAFSLIFPLIAPAVALLLSLTLVAHRYLIGYVYGRTRSSTGGLLQIWLLRRFATLLAFQPLVLGLIFLTRGLWEEAGALLGSAVAIAIFAESFCSWKTRQPGIKSLNNVVQNSLESFLARARPAHRRNVDEESISLVSTTERSKRPRESFASVLDMMSVTLAVMPSTQNRGPVPIPTETLDDLVATERAARTHPDAPPHLPPLSFTDHADDMAGILYAPELIAPPPIIWLPNDAAGIAGSEAHDLVNFHSLQVTLDVKAKEDVLPRHTASSRRSSILMW